MKIKDSFFELICKDNISSSENDTVTIEDNAKACLMMMNTPEYQDSLQKIEKDEMTKLSKATIFDIF